MINFINNFTIHWKYILIITLLFFFISGGILGYQWWRTSLSDESSEVTPEKYGLWERSFDELVAGYAVFQEVEGLSELYGYIDQTNVYFKVIDYSDNEFIKSLEQKIAEGNGVNLKDKNDGNILFNLGCLKDGEIIADGKGQDYIDEETQKAILESTKDNPVTIVFHFEPELGRGCLCCSFANKVWLYKHIK